MKILIITWACDCEDVSEPQIAHKWVHEISKHHEVTLFSVSRPDRFGCVKKQFPELEVIEWQDIKVPRGLDRFRAIVKPGYFIYFFKARHFLKTFVKKNNFDLIHHLNPFTWRYPSPAYDLGVPLVRGPLGGGLPTPVPFKSTLKKTPLFYNFFRKSDQLRLSIDPILKNSYRYTNCVLMAAPYVTNLLRSLAIKYYKIEIEHGFNATENSFRRESILHSPSRSKNIQLLFVGRVLRTKGVRDAIRAIGQMNYKQRVFFTIIGDGSDLSNCKKEIRTLELENTIFCKGWCDKNQVEAAYRNSDIFVFPSFREPTGGVILEAMSHSLPCLVCDYGGPAYMVNDECGKKIAPCPPKEYATKIAEALDFLVINPDIREQMGKSALLSAQKNFDWQSKMNRINSTYHSLIHNKHTPSK